MEGWLSIAAYDWIALKAGVHAFVGLDRDATHVLASFVLLLALALVLRRQLWSWHPWCGLLLLQLINEAATAYADGILEGWELRGSLGDVLLVMAVPTLLLAACRMKPSLVDSSGTVLVPVPAQPQLSARTPEDVEYAEFEEISTTIDPSEPDGVGLSGTAEREVRLAPSLA